MIRCPSCRAELDPAAPCSGCGRLWPARDGLPALYDEEVVRGTDRLMRAIYDGFAALHDPLTRHLLPRLQRDVGEDEMREAYLARLRLRDLRPGAKILEVGVGTGANLPLVRARAPHDAEIWGVDLSLGMIRRARSRADGTHLLLADAHALPFADGVFDRVYHVGAMGSFRDPGRALAEMARVAKPGTPIVVVDEELDPTGSHRRRDRLAFRLLTFYDTDPRCPIDRLPPGSAVLEHAAISRFYYCLSFATGPSDTSARSTVAP